MALEKPSDRSIGKYDLWYSLYLQKAFTNKNIKKLNLPNTMRQSKEILSLPINQFMTNKELQYISKKINNFYK